MKAKLHFFPNGDTGAPGQRLRRRRAEEGGRPTRTSGRFVDYLLGTEAQTYFAEETYEYPLVAGVATAPGLPALAVAAGPEDRPQRPRHARRDRRR